MPKNKQTRPTAATVEQVKAGAGLAEASVSTTDNTTAAGDRQIGIAGLLSHGADHGLHLADLVRLTGLSERAVRAMIHQERRLNVPILSNNKDGYFLPSSEHERAACVRSLRQRAVEIQEAADGIEGAAGLD